MVGHFLKKCPVLVVAPCGILVLPTHPARDQFPSPIPCIGRWILNHWTTREVLGRTLLSQKKRALYDYAHWNIFAIYDYAQTPEIRHSWEAGGREYRLYDSPSQGHWV